MRYQPPFFGFQRLAIVDLDESVRSQEICAGVEAGRFGRTERICHVRILIVLPLAESRRQVLNPAADEQGRDWPDSRATTEMVRTDRVVRSIVSVRVGSEAKEVFLRIVAVACPGLEVQVALCKPRKLEPRLGRPIPLDTAGRPDFKRPRVGEEIAIAKAQAIGEPAARGQRAELWMEALAVEDEDRPILGEVQGPLQAVRLVGLDLVGLLFAPLPVGLFARRGSCDHADARREDQQRQAQHYSEHGRESTSMGRQPAM